MTPIVIGLVVVNDAAARHLDLAALAVDHVVGVGDVLIERRGVGDQLEGRAGLVDIAHRVILQQRGSGAAKLVGIEGGANGERENLAGVHVLHDHGAVVGVGRLHVVVERALGHELDVFVDGELEILARLGLVRDGAEHAATRVHRGEHAAGHAVELRVEFASRPPRPLSSRPT